MPTPNAASLAIGYLKVYGLFLKGQGREDLAVIEQEIKGFRPLESITPNS